ncbi:MAG: hypothetical protein GY859_39815, partial [Desulfobacterales bacterium]|nr:hypothetical protein [Desulfobacterales bacterium]
MTFTPEIWKKQVSERLGHFSDWLKKRGEREVPHLVYGGLCGMTLRPLVKAAQSGSFLPAMLALGGIAGGVGGNLIASQLEKWKERADESEVHDWAAEQAPNNPDLRDALDAIMEQFDVMAEARAGLDEKERAWFSETLAKELQQLGNLPRYQAELTGDGAIAQGAGARAVGKDAILVEGDVNGDVIGKSKTILFNQENQRVGTQYNIKGDLHQGAAPENDEEALRIYREFLARTCSNVSLRGIDRGTCDPGSLENPLGLANVYIDLNTTTPKSKKGEKVDGLKKERIGREESETAPLSALEAAARNER